MIHLLSRRMRRNWSRRSRTSGSSRTKSPWLDQQGLARELMIRSLITPQEKKLPLKSKLIRMKRVKKLRKLKSILKLQHLKSNLKK